MHIVVDHLHQFVKHASSIFLLAVNLEQIVTLNILEERGGGPDQEVGREGTEVTVMRTEGVTVPMKNMKGGKEIREKERRGRR